MQIIQTEIVILAPKYLVFLDILGWLADLMAYLLLPTIDCC